jgi:hypothetical protein
MQSVYQWEKTADYPAISWVLAAIHGFLCEFPPPALGTFCPNARQKRRLAEAN